MSVITSFLFALWLWSCKQNSASPACFNLSYTTLRAASFSETNRTFFPSLRHSAMMLVIVWLLPVPGGPCKTKLFPVFAISIASIWLESASTTLCSSINGSETGMDVPSSSPVFSVSVGSPKSWRTFWFARIVAALSFRSRYILIFRNEKIPILHSDVTVHCSFETRRFTFSR